MAKKAKAPETASVLLTAIEAEPARRRELLAAALTGPGQAVIQSAIRDDPALRAEFRAALTDVDGLDSSPWLVQYARRLDVREAIPELVIIARADSGSKCDVAYTRLSADVAAGGAISATTLWYLVAHPELVAGDPRWIDVALAALRTPEGAEAARAFLQKALTRELRDAHFARSPPAVAPLAVSPEEVASARAWADELFAKLPAFPAPEPAVHERLDALAEIVGHVPPFVRALHERVDGLDVAGAKSADRVVLYDTATILKAARAWDDAHDPRHTPRELVPDFLWPVAPDGFTKAGLSGGPDYAFGLPSHDADPVLSNVPKKPRYAQFVARELRRAARNLAGHR